MSFVESVIELLLKKLAEPLVREALFLSGVRNQVELLVLEFEQMESFLEDADAKQEGDRRVKRWVQHVRDVAYDAEDVIDALVLKMATSRRKCFIRRYACIFNNLIDLHQVGSEIQRINGKIHRISESKLTYGIENIGQGVGTSSSGLSLQEKRLTSPNAQEPDFVGFEKDLKALVWRLTDEGEVRRSVISVVGMGGLGKTTLTRRLYNTDSVKKHFQTHAWISVSQQFAARDVLLSLTKQYMAVTKEIRKMNVIELADNISKHLDNKRYLVVLDDVWTYEAWDALKIAFPEKMNGSRIVLTTRNKDVALHADAQSKPHELRFLNDDERWELFCKKTFPGQNNICPTNLQKLGREIVGKCQGLPLAIVVVGGLLSRKLEEREWENVQKSISWQLVKGEYRISDILSLSYKDLPYYLKPCFLYLGIFPEDHEFLVKELIQMWAAEGFLQERGEETLEEVGEECLKELIQRSMVKVSKTSSSGGIKSCSIHDLLRDLSISEAKEGMFLHVHRASGNAINTPAFPPPTARRLSIHHDVTSQYISSGHSTPHLRSLLIYTQDRGWVEKKQEKFLFRTFMLLRVLYLQGTFIKILPRAIGELIHLRYLGCSYTSLKSLPSSIGNLPNLQTLSVASSSYIIEVPSTIRKMKQLRHLQVKGIQQDRCWGMIKGHPKLERISNLQTLSFIKSGKWMKGCFGKLTHLRKIGICLETRAHAKVFYDSVVKLYSLQSLSVESVKHTLSLPPLSHLLKLCKLRLCGKLRKLPESNEFPTNLTKLTLDGSSLKEDPIATLEKLKNLQILRLHQKSYLGKKITCSKEGFPRLKSLNLQSLHKFEEWILEEGAMPSLLHLRINYCNQLKKLPEGMKPTLKKLELLWMPDKFKERVREGGEDWDKIQQIPSIQISN
ncbi:putative disease resistance protein At1g50180 [Magnolia sinica]|uniref:putative disease resistance protein At1g50180 n=1 Tax=Magnolia sinica TaxID=86752 RepID=UPI00265A37F7|nr:putative disease resistance protein At1g50180 [Magnolia sinica]